MSFKLSYNFEGNPKSKPEQNLSGASQKLTRDKLLQKSQGERLKRQQQRAKLQSSHVLQAYFRSYLVRKRVKQEQRRAFDANQATLPLNVLLSKLLFFYDPASDSERLHRLCLDILAKQSEVATWFKTTSTAWLLRRLLVRCAENLGNAAAMQCLDLFARDEAALVYITRKGYFRFLRGFLESAPAESVPTILMLAERPFKLPKDSPDLSAVVIPAFCSSFLEADCSTHVKNLLIPFMKTKADFPYEQLLEYLNSGCYFQDTNSLFHSLLALEPDDYEPTRDGVQVLSKLTKHVHLLKQKVYLISDDSDEDDVDMDSAEDRAVLEDILHVLNKPDRVRKWLNFLSVRGKDEVVFTSFINICHNLLLVYDDSMRKYLLLYRLGLNGRFLNDLWSFLNRTGPVQSRLRTPDLMSWGDTQMALSVFCDMFTFYTETLTDRENTDTSETFSHTHLSSMSQALKVLSLDLIEVAFPMCRTSSVLPTPEILHLYHTCLNCLKMLYMLDVRRGFCPAGFWTAKKLHISYDLYRKNYLSKHVRPFFSTTTVTGNDDEQLPPLSTIEQRSLAIFQMLPFLIDFNTRVLLLRELCRSSLGDNDYQRMQHDFLSDNIVIRRTHLYEDAFDKLSAVNDLKRKVKIQFINSMGLEEAGIDGGGVFKEFLNEVLKTAFDPNRGFFLLTADNTLYPNPNVQSIVENFVDHYYFIGKLVGKAIFEHILVDLPLAEFFLAKLLVDRASAHYLKSLDPVLYRNLLYLRDYSGDVSDLGLDFTTISSDLGEMRIMELKPHGRHIAVTNENRLEYVQRLADLKLNVQMQKQCVAFREGLDTVVSLQWLKLFNHAELQVIVSGDNQAIDVEDFRAHAVYGGEFTADHSTIEMFWRVVDAFTDHQRKQLLKFVTSCSRPPLFGFKELDPPFCIQSSGSEDRMPTSSTCLNLLKIPIVRDEAVLRQKLLAAIEQQAGFELS